MSAERHAPWALLCLMLAAACAPPARPAPELVRVMPEELRQSTGANDGYIDGNNLFARLEDAFWSSSPATMDTGFRVRVGEVELAAELITQVSASRLDVDFPPGLPAGPQSVTVITPDGLSATLRDALFVDPAGSEFFIETAPDGAGHEVGTRQLAPGGVALELHAVHRGPSGRFRQRVPSTWSLTEDVGTLTPSADGTSATLLPLRPGTAHVVATPLDGSSGAQTGELRVAPMRFLAFANPPVSGEAGACLGPFVLETRDATGASAPVVLGTPVTLAAEPAGLTFHLDAGCARGATAAVTLSPGESQGPFWLRAPAEGSVTLQASTPWEGSATQTVTVLRSTVVTLAFAPLGPQTAGRPFPVTLTALDAQGQVATGFSALPDLTFQGEGTLTCISGCAVPFSAGRWSGTVSVTGTPGDGRQLRASAGAVTGASNAFSLLATRTPPLARPRALQPAVREGVAMAFDASASTDRESPASALRYSWDFSGTSTHPPPWTPWSTSPTASFTYTGEGYRLPRLAVMDPDGDIGYATVLVVAVRAAQTVCVVDAPSAAADDGALSCTLRGPDGRLSLAEALRLQGNPQGYKAILIAPGVTVSGPASFTLTDDLWLMGSEGSALSGVSFTVPADRALILGSLRYQGASARITAQGSGVLALDTVELQGGAAVSGESTVYLLNSQLSGCTGACLTLNGAAASLYARESTVVDSPLGVQASGCGGSGVDLVRMVFARNTTGMRIGGACATSRLVGVTFDGNTTGLDVRVGTGVELRNAIFTRNDSAATCAGTPFAQSSALLGWSNGTDGCLPAASISLREDPRFIAPGGDDYRLEQWSPAVNAGTPLSLDTNWGAPGNHTGSAPDLGGRETW